MKKLDVVPENSEEKMPIRSKVVLDIEYERYAVQSFVQNIFHWYFSTCPLDLTGGMKISCQVAHQMKISEKGKPNKQSKQKTSLFLSL